MSKVNMNILIDTELKARLKTMAEQENRTLSNLVETELKRLVGIVATVPDDPPKNRQCRQKREDLIRFKKNGFT